MNLAYDRMEEAMILLLENCELVEDRRKGKERKEGGKKKENNADVFHCVGEVERVTNRIEVGQPRKIFQGKTGCKKGWKKAHSILPRLFNRRGNSYRAVQLPSEILLNSLTRR